MVSIADALTVLFPDAVPLRDYVLQDDGKGPYIRVWNIIDKQPSSDELAVVTQEQVDAIRRKKETQAAMNYVATSNHPAAVALRVVLRNVQVKADPDQEAAAKMIIAAAQAEPPVAIDSPG